MPGPMEVLMSQVSIRFDKEAYRENFERTNEHFELKMINFRTHLFQNQKLCVCST